MRHHRNTLSGVDAESIEAGRESFRASCNFAVVDPTPVVRRLIWFVNDRSSIGVHEFRSTKEIIDRQCNFHDFDASQFTAVR